MLNAIFKPIVQWPGEQKRSHQRIGEYGVTTHAGEQYKGFARLEAPKQENKRDVAVQFIASWADVRNEDVLADLESAYRIAARRLHPDSGGHHDMFVQLQQHYRFLKGVAA